MDTEMETEIRRVISGTKTSDQQWERANWVRRTPAGAATLWAGPRAHRAAPRRRAAPSQVRAADEVRGSDAEVRGSTRRAAHAGARGSTQVRVHAGARGPRRCARPPRAGARGLGALISSVSREQRARRPRPGVGSGAPCRWCGGGRERLLLGRVTDSIVFVHKSRPWDPDPYQPGSGCSCLRRAARLPTGLRRRDSGSRSSRGAEAASCARPFRKSRAGRPAVLDASLQQESQRNLLAARQNPRPGGRRQPPGIRELVPPQRRGPPALTAA